MKCQYCNGHLYIDGELLLCEKCGLIWCEKIEDDDIDDVEEEDFPEE